MQTVLFQDLREKPLGDRALVDADRLPFEVGHGLDRVLGEDAISANRGIDGKYLYGGDAV